MFCIKEILIVMCLTNVIGCLKEKRICDMKENPVVIDLSPPERPHLKYQWRTVPVFKKTCSLKTSIMELKVKRKRSFCNEIIFNYQEPDCNVKIETVAYDEDQLKKMLNSQKCMTGKTCHVDECWGPEAETCHQNDMKELQPHGQTESVGWNRVLFRHSCIQLWDCHLLKFQPEPYFHENEGNVFTLCIQTPNGEIVCDIDKKAKKETELGYVIYGFDVECKTEELSMSCIKGSEGAACLLKGNLGVALEFGNNRMSSYKNSVYLMDEFDFISVSNSKTRSDLDPTTISDSHELFEMLKYTQLETMLDIKMIEISIWELTSLVSRMLVLNSLKDSEFLGDIIGKPSYTAKIMEGKAFQYPCLETKATSVDKKCNLLKEGPMVVGFPNEQLLMSECAKPSNLSTSIINSLFKSLDLVFDELTTLNFSTTTLSDYRISLILEEEERKRTSESKATGGGVDSCYSLSCILSYVFWFVNELEKFVIWFNFFFVILILKKIWNNSLK